MEPVLQENLIIQENEKKKQDNYRDGCIQIVDNDNDMYNKSSFISKLFFSWSLPAMLIANQTPLKIYHLGTVDEEFQSKNIFSEIHKIWYGGQEDYQKERKNAVVHKKKWALFNSILYANRGKLIIMFILALICAAIEQFLIFLLRDIVLTFQVKYEPSEDQPIFPLHVSISLFLILRFCAIVALRQSYFLEFQIGIRASNQLTSLIYDKLMKIGVYAKELYTEGEITNLIQIDAEKFGALLYLGPGSFLVPLQLIAYMYQLFHYFRATFLSGTAMLVLLLLFVTMFQAKYLKVQDEYMNSKDDRMRITAQTFNILKTLKLYAWEQKFTQKIKDKRAIEMNKWRLLENFDVFTSFLYWCTPLLVSFVSIGCYQIFYDKMNVANISASIAIFNAMSWPMYQLPAFVAGLQRTLVSMERIQKFLFQADVDVNAVEHDDRETSLMGIAIQVKNCSFSVETKTRKKAEDKDKTKCSTEQSQISMMQNQILYRSNSGELDVDIKKQLRKDSDTRVYSEGKQKIILKNIDLAIYTGELVGIIGEVGSGKSALLSAILNNMITIKNSENSHLIVNGSISYVSQASWIMNETLQKNILFFQEMNQAKYEQIMDDCQLTPDLDCLAGRDQTEIGEKGINLSGGQQVRVAIARALYRDSDIYLFDDPLSALDAHVGKKIFDKVIIERLRKKTRIVVTHALQYISHMDKIIYMHKGKIYFMGTYSELINQPFFCEFFEKMKMSQNKEKKAEKTEKKLNEMCETKSEIVRITKDEEQELGSVKWAIYSKFILYFHVGFLVIGIVMNILNILFQTGADYWITYWTVQENLTKEINFQYFSIYSAICLLCCIAVFLRVFVISRGEMRLGKALHEKMINSLIKAPINLFHERTPKGQILNRLSKDLENASTIGWTYGWLLRSLFSFIGAIIICSLFNFYSIISLPILLAIGIFLTWFFISAGRDLNRLEGIARSPIIGTYTETIQGVSVIRAYHYEENFKRKLFAQLDNLYKVQLFFNGCRNWFGIHLELTSFSLLIFILAFIYFCKEMFSSQGIGLMITYSLSVADSLYWALEQTIYIERELVSLERCDAYTNIIQEKAYETNLDKVLTDWPRSGSIKFENYSVKYRPELNITALKDINCYINPGEKVGIVGRTGSGKSTFCLALFRMLEPLSGTIYIDGIDIQELGLKKLRESMTIIPQDPTLVEGTLRENVDPIGLYTDEEIINSLNILGLNYLLEESPKRSENASANENIIHDDEDEENEENQNINKEIVIIETKRNIGLDLGINENGDNLSIGEKQLICIARALLRKSQIVVMDEATSSIDVKTEFLIQQAISSAMSKATVITIAHRIKTIINYDRLFVLDEGKLIENDTPENLLRIPNGLFAELYSQSKL